MRTQTEKDPGFNLICSNLKDLLLSDEHKTSQGLSLARSIITGLQSNPSSAWPVEEKGTLTPCPTQHPEFYLTSVLRELSSFGDTRKGTAAQLRDSAALWEFLGYGSQICLP